MVLSDETVLIEQYANDRGPGREVKGGGLFPWSW